MPSGQLLGEQVDHKVFRCFAFHDRTRSFLYCGMKRKRDWPGWYQEGNETMVSALWRHLQDLQEFWVLWVKLAGMTVLVNLVVVAYQLHFVEESSSG